MVVMEVEGDLKSMTTMLKELTLDRDTPTLAVLGSKGDGEVNDWCHDKPLQVNGTMPSNCFVPLHLTSMAVAVAGPPLPKAVVPSRGFGCRIGCCSKRTRYLIR